MAKKHELKYTGAEVDELLDVVNGLPKDVASKSDIPSDYVGTEDFVRVINEVYDVFDIFSEVKQDTIVDLADIREGAAKGNTAVQHEELAKVATSGKYEDLVGKPTKVSELENDRGYLTGLKIDGTLSLSSKTDVSNTQQLLKKTNEVKFFLISDSKRSLPSSETCYTVPSDVATQLGLASPNWTVQASLNLLGITLPSFGVNVGDLIALTRVKVKVADLASAIGKDLSILGDTEIEVYQYKILNTNDAKAYGYNGVAEGVAGLMSPWDKAQVNKIEGVEALANAALPKADALPSRWDANMNNALETGVYPWCTLGRPSDSTGAYTCIVKRTSTDDGSYDTIEQTAYGREDELGRVFKRIIFVKNDGTDNQYGEWLEITDKGLEKEINQFFEELGGYVEEELGKKVDKMDGKGLSEEDFTKTLKLKLEGLKNYDDAEIRQKVNDLSDALDALVGTEDATKAIDTFNEVVAFLKNVENTEDLSGIIGAIEQQIADKQDALVSGQTIKTINGQSVLGSGDIEIEGGGSVDTLGDDKIVLGELEDHDNDAVGLTLLDATSPEFTANRLAFWDVNYITIEKSNDGGSTWEDYEVLDWRKTNLVSGLGGAFISLGGKDTAQVAELDQLRITITAYEGCQFAFLERLYVYVGDGGATDCKCLFEYQQNKDVATDTWHNTGWWTVKGWNGWNKFNSPYPKSCLNLSQNKHFRQIRLTFKFGGYQSGYENKTSFSVINIASRGVTAFNEQNYLARYGHIVGYDGNGMAVVEKGLTPKNDNNATLGTSSKRWKEVYANNFIGNASSATKATQDGNGNVITDTYAKKSELGDINTILESIING